MNPQQALQKLLSEPDYFVKHYPIYSGGDSGNHTAGQVNLRVFHLFRRDPLVPGMTPSAKVGHMGATRPGRVLPFVKHEISSFAIDTFAPAGASNQLINAHSVPMTPYGAGGFNITQLTPYLLDGAGDGVMVTGQLSGCCFCWLPVGGSLWCTHIRPLGIGGTQLHNLINISGRFAGHAQLPLGTFGRNDYPVHATVIGVRRAGSWRLYAQTSNDQGRTIAQAWRLYPGATTVL